MRAKLPDVGMGRIRNFLVASGAVGGAVTGVLLLWGGLKGSPPDAAPLPARTFSLKVEDARRLTAVRHDARAAGVRRLSRISPSRVVIPSLGVDAPIVDAPVRARELVVPGDVKVVGRWGAGASLGADQGDTLLAGHVDVRGDLGALHQLSRIEPGAEVYTSDAVGRVQFWTAASLIVRAKDHLPSWQASGPRRLILVTCGGPVQRREGRWSYRDNILVTAVPAALKR
ncbi:class F sortase [Dermatophilus congolensis]|uniref:class F sortase n=1 Tax=Dermatophilus congolensis TaxID=1863 RepID=UPI001AAE6930|nr:class F sortase [Dermatophilus congolensis]MBO3142475.1 class F sortase [Dermatophilus congolensis]MBO3151464.1 class F sortase [Dermatophilus congolensis]MBO3161532.1 class F sortase [Dermatophilus congolensis]MBO3162750.1 class F sortase [Dermatophilus congolensis]MBO3176304.1 class F sortase [Dermatophilus congolensis]